MGGSQWFGVFSDGDFGGTGAKFFIQPHPTDPAKQINFACLERNESGTYFRGSVGIRAGAAEIEVPESFRLVTEDGSLAATRRRSARRRSCGSSRSRSIGSSCARAPTSR